MKQACGLIKLLTDVRRIIRQPTDSSMQEGIFGGSLMTSVLEAQVTASYKYNLIAVLLYLNV